MIHSLITKLLGSKNWYIDDTPQIWRGIVEDPHAFATWDDVEYCLNNPQFYDCLLYTSPSPRDRG